MRKLREIFLKAALIAAAVITGCILLFLIGIILKRGLPQLSWSFLTTATSYLAGTTGILPNVCNTLYLILIAMGAALPLGVGAAVYITEYAENPRVVRLISFAAETLTGIPSILFGLIGMLFFIKLGGVKQGVLAGGLTLALMVLPTVMANTRESLLAVPESLPRRRSRAWQRQVAHGAHRRAAERRGRHRDRLHPLRRPHHRRERGASLHRWLRSAAAGIQGGARILLGVAFRGAVSLRKRAGQV